MTGSDLVNKCNTPYNPGKVRECLITCKCGRFYETKSILLKCVLVPTY